MYKIAEKWFDKKTGNCRHHVSIKNGVQSCFPIIFEKPIISLTGKTGAHDQGRQKWGGGRGAIASLSGF